MGHKTSEARVFSETQVKFPEISYKSFTYPGDEEALAALKAVPGAAPVLTYLQENFTEQFTFITNNQQMIRAGRNSFSSLHALVERCCEILSCPMPELYLTSNPVLNAYTTGQRRTSIVLHSALVETLTLDELSFVIGHEIGHIKCAHGLYRQLGDLLVRYWEPVTTLIPLPGLGLLRIPLLMAYWEWYRRAEFTCDRAGLLCVQDVEPGLRALGKLAGKVAGYEDEFHIESAIAQTQAHSEANKLVQLIAIFEAFGNTHPFIPVRLRQLQEYAAGEEYKRLMQGLYEHDVLGLHEGGLRVKCRCGTLVNAKLSFCPECGSPLGAPDQLAAPAGPVACSGCGTPLEPGVKFCPKCGARQQTAAAPQQGQEPTSLDKWKNTASSFFKK